MSTSFKATTKTIDGTHCMQLESLHERDLPKAQVNLAIYNAIPAYLRSTVLLSTYMRSRGGWAMETARTVFRLAKVEGLPFLSGSRTPGMKIIPILADNESGKTYVENHAFLLDKAALLRANGDINRVFEWSIANIDTLADGDFMGFYADSDGIREAILYPNISEALTYDSESGQKIPGVEDGDGPWYFYSWLNSVQQVIKAALLYNQHVLHTTDLFD